MLARTANRTPRTASAATGVCVLLLLAMGGGLFVAWRVKDNEPEQPAAAATKRGKNFRMPSGPPEGALTKPEVAPPTNSPTANVSPTVSSPYRQSTSTSSTPTPSVATRTPSTTTTRPVATSSFRPARSTRAVGYSPARSSGPATAPARGTRYATSVAMASSRSAPSSGGFKAPVDLSAPKKCASCNQKK
jgi:hypothetical protein